MNIALKYPEDEVKIEAQYMLDYLNKGESNETMLINLNTLYKYEPDILHYWLVVMTDDFDKVYDVMNSISDYNEMYYSLDKLEVSLKMLDRTIRILMVQVFQSKSACREKT